MSTADEALYYDSIHFAAAIVGINTSAMVESFIQRRPVLAIRDDRFRETQEGTLHFRHLLPASGGAVQHASTLDERRRQLQEAIEQPERQIAPIESFLRTFVRPRGLEDPGHADPRRRDRGALRVEHVAGALPPLSAAGAAQLEPILIRTSCSVCGCQVCQEDSSAARNSSAASRTPGQFGAS